jgi:DNA (cytosine-5)-methyltransferase 1
MKFIELFCGIGGFRYGLEQIQKTTDYRWDMSYTLSVSDSEEQRQQYNFRCVWANDIDKYACQVYRYRFGTGELYEGDIRTVDAATIPDHDLIVGGFPCQSFSIAGKRGGFEDTRGTLFFEICLIARAKRTKYLFLENVKGLLNHNQGKTFETIIRTLDELGYDCEWQVLNSKFHGVPQNRERVFIIGHLRGERRFQVFPIGEGNGADNELQGRPITGAITARRGNSQSDGDYIIESQRQAQDLKFMYGIMGDKNKMWLEDGKDNSRNFPQGQRVYSPEGISAQLTEQGGGWGAKTGLYEIPETAQALQTDGQLRTGTSCGTNKPQSARSIRRLTPVEWERLQGFKDNWTKYGIDKNGKEVLISDSQRYKMCGNAVTTNVITAIGEKLVKKG